MPVFPVSRSTIQILRRFSKKLRRHEFSRPQLLEALVLMQINCISSMLYYLVKLILLFTLWKELFSSCLEVKALKDRRTLSRTYKSWGREDVSLRNFFENLRKICIFPHETGRKKAQFDKIFQHFTCFFMEA